MNGKKLRLSEYKMTYGQETIYVNMYGVFKNKKNGNKYAIYSYENKNILNYGTFFQRNKEAVIMASKENPKEIIEDLVQKLLNEETINKYEPISLKDIETIEIIDEYTSDMKIELNKLKELTIPKPVVVEITPEPEQKKKPISFAWTFFTLFILVVIAFFLMNPELLIGNDIHYSCSKNYLHKKLPASVKEDIEITISGLGKIKTIDKTTEHTFSDKSYYQEFKEKSYYYQYMEEGDTYKLIDEEYKYRLFSDIDINSEDNLLPTNEDELISYYKDKGYTCKRVEIYE